MAGCGLQLRVDGAYHDEAKAFFDFLRCVARRHPVAFAFRTVRAGEFHVTLDGSPGAKIDAFLQEIMLSRALYYYACGIKNRRTVVGKVIAPLFQQLLKCRFSVTHDHSLRRHVLGTLSDELIPSEMADPFANKYDGLFRKWDLRMITDYDFVRDLDDLLTDFMLTYLGHTSGEKSLQFDVLVGRCGRENIVFEKPTRKAFIRIHELRSRGLHRLEKILNRSEISTLALEIFLYFQYFDEFMDSQDVKTLLLKGKRYRRIKYGDEELKRSYGGGPPDSEAKARCAEYSQFPCHDCHAIKGQYHCDNCDVERCPRCFTQLISCGCGYEDGDRDDKSLLFG
jgi:hypothetical protein